MLVKKRNFSPGKKIIKSLYISFMLRFVGKALQALSRFDKMTREEILRLPENCLIGMVVYPFGETGKGPAMFLKKTHSNSFRFIPDIPENEKPTLLISFKDIDMAALVFTFKEKTTEAQAFSRFTADGPLAIACTFVRILNRAEILLLPKILAVRAVRRYEKPPKQFICRTQLYIRTLFGY